MKKLFFVFFLLICFEQLALAQAVPATGTVKDEQGNPVRYAFVWDRPFNRATFSDSLGNFKLTINPNSTLQITSKGYSGTVINTAANTNFDVVLKRMNGAGAGIDAAGRTQGGSSLGSTHQNQDLQFEVGAAFAPSNKGEAHGSQYFFDDWAHGFVINPQDSLLQDPDFLYNYDKMGGGLLFTQDAKSARAANNEQVKSFTLFSNSGETAVFEKVPNIDNTKYVQVLSSGKKYKIYKSISTQFVKSNYQTNGMSSSGNNYDEYVDEYTYYILNVKTNSLQKISLKKKSLKDAFASDPDKLNKFMSENSGDIDDAYLSNLGDYMNQ